MKMIVDARQQYFPEYADLAIQLDHDVRSPLTAICTYAECLGQAEAIEPQRRERYARAISGEARRLGRLCANFAVLATPQPEERLRELDVQETIEGALEDLAEFTEILEVKVELLPCSSPLSLFWPRTILRHLLTATIESVLSAVAQGAVITVQARSEARDVALLIRPEGPQPFLCSPDRLGFRAAARLVGTRGGSLMLLDGDQPQVRLNLPFSGRLCEGPLSCGLEQSA